LSATVGVKKVEANEGMTPQEMIRANAELVVGRLREASEMEDFGYNAESVEWLYGFIERQRVRPEFSGEEAAERMSQTLGSFLGECVIRCYGGEWREVEGTWAIAFGDGGDDAAFPFNKVRKQFENGAGDSVLSWFETIPIIFAQQIGTKLGQPPLAKKHSWWKPGS
jgi:hypothetical protein